MSARTAIDALGGAAAEQPSERYPLMLDLRDRHVAAIGGGPVSLRRVRGLLDAGARVSVVAPHTCEGISELAAAGRVRVLAEEFSVELLAALDVDPVWLLHTATGDPAVDAAVAEFARQRRIWCIRADHAASSPAWVPAVARDSSGITVAVSAGADPRRAVAVRDVVTAELAAGRLPIRGPGRASSGRAGGAGGAVGSDAVISVQRGDGTGQDSGAPGATPAAMGRVALVGGGPGEPGLLTVRGRRLLAEADVIVTDRLGPRNVLDELAEAIESGGVELVDVGKTPGHHPMPQHVINDLLVEHARRGRLVVRLKGGDPFVLGRGGEEALHCAQAGVPVEVVPGITSATSVPAAAGIPVTQRGITASFVVASAHDGASSALAAASSAPRDATLVLLMGVSSLARTAEQLVSHGRDAETPVAIIERGWTPQQRTTVATLATCAAEAQRVGVRSPAVIVVGPVVGVRAELAAAGWLAP